MDSFKTNWLCISSRVTRWLGKGPKTGQGGDACDLTSYDFRASFKELFLLSFSLDRTRSLEEREYHSNRQRRVKIVLSTCSVPPPSWFSWTAAGTAEEQAEELSMWGLHKHHPRPCHVAYLFTDRCQVADAAPHLRDPSETDISLATQQNSYRGHDQKKTDKGLTGMERGGSAAGPWNPLTDDYTHLQPHPVSNTSGVDTQERCHRAAGTINKMLARKCDRSLCAPICWDQVGERILEGPEMIEVTNEKVAVAREKLKEAQTRQKSYADRHRRALEFQPGEHVFLKVSPTRGVRRFGIKGKLSPRFIGPFEILDRVGEVSYRLALPPQLSHVHNVFHVSLLRGYKYHPLHVISYPFDQIREDLSYTEEPESILDRQDRVMRNKMISFVKILWRNHPEREATWETEESIRTSYPHFLP
ncbi:putative nucleotidyltransferase, ribonuclease H [Tanacetum coccineum]